MHSHLLTFASLRPLSGVRSSSKQPILPNCFAQFGSVTVVGSTKCRNDSESHFVFHFVRKPASQSIRILLSRRMIHVCMPRLRRVSRQSPVKISFMLRSESVTVEFYETLDDSELFCGLSQFDLSEEYWSLFFLLRLLRFRAELSHTYACQPLRSYYWIDPEEWEIIAAKSWSEVWVAASAKWRPGLACKDTNQEIFEY